MRPVAVLVLLGVLVAGGTVVATAGSYSVSVTGPTTEVPAIDVSIGGNTHTVTEVAIRDSGSVTVEATGPEGETYDVNLYDSAGDVVQASRKRGGTTTTTFDMSCCEPGTYGVALYDSEIKDLTGIVVAGYAVDLDHPSSAEQNTSATATVDLSDIGGGAIESVKVVLTGAGDPVVADAEPQNGSTYEATISLENVSTGTYTAYGVVLSPDTFENGEHEVIGLERGSSFTVEAPDDTEEGSDSGGDTSPPADSTPTDTPASDPTATPSDARTTATPTEPDETTATPTASPTVTDGEHTGGTTETNTDATETDDRTDTDDGPADTATTGDGEGFGIAVAVLALLAALIATRQQ